MVLNTSIRTKTVNLQTLRANANEALIYLDAKLATEVQVQLEGLLSKSGLDRKSFEELTILLAKIKFVRFVSLNDNELIDLITNYLSLSFTIENFDLKDKIGKRILYLGEIEAQMDFMGRVVKAFEGCKGPLGTQNFSLGGKSFLPTIGNWIKVYLDSPVKSAVRTNIDEWSFVEQGLPTKLLNKNERKILIEILEIYDSPKNRVYSYHFLPESDDENELFSNFDLFTTFPGLTINFSDSEWKNKYQKLLNPSVEEEYKIPPVVMEEVQGKISLDSEKFILPESAQADFASPPPNPPHSSFAKATADRQGEGNKTNVGPAASQAPVVPVKPAPRPVSIQDILQKKESGMRNEELGTKLPLSNSPQPPLLQRGVEIKAGPGIAFGGANLNSESLKKEYEEKQKAQTAQIDEKLDDLKKRVDKK